MTERVYFWGEDENIPGTEPIQFSAAKLSKNIKITTTDPDGIAESTVVEGIQDDEVERGGWGNKLDFLFSCISVSVGLGNVWRFPYLCYKNGGGSFLITYFIAMFLCGIPIFFQEVAIGQYLGSGGMTLVGHLCPILQGVGFSTMIIVFFLDVYYCIIIAWTIFYLINCFTQLPSLPWENCDNWWNTDACFKGSSNQTALKIVHNTSIPFGHNHTRTPVEEYWDSRVLGITSGIEDLGGMQWELVGCLFLAWVFVYIIIWKGLHQSGKIIWFTALFPYFVLIILLFRGITLEGAGEGLLYYVKPDWSKLATSGPWIDGATQIFFAYSVGTGALPALGSYNNFHHNMYKDAVITCFVNTLTSLLAGCVTFSILGHIALTQGSTVSDVVKSGPGLVFLTYPEVVLKLPGSPAWAIIFFVMLLILGIDSEFCNVESFVTGLVDYWPNLLRPHRRKFTLCCVFAMFILGLPMVTKGGAYVFQLMDFYSASGMSILWVCFFQTIAISWIFGGDKFCSCIYEMTGRRPNKFFYISWVFLAPAVMIGIFLFYCIQYTPVTYGKDYKYPEWAEVLGLLISFSSMIWIPLYAIYYLLTQPGTILENLQNGILPRIKHRGKPPKAEASQNIPLSESKAVFIYHDAT
ncbi:sodium- and chloride-dependent GABA transporter 1-like [Artemia franciscana]|uniref:Transporter n=1 Tax=Artemia franciscana TaxID=6661 RepID=A0AA88I2R8_ARTSF|nr:hypothetical protein QYM36_008739 [Artemia franciscana]